MHPGPCVHVPHLTLAPLACTLHCLPRSARVFKALFNGEVVAAKEIDIGAGAEMQQAFLTVRRPLALAVLGPGGCPLRVVVPAASSHLLGC